MGGPLMLGLAIGQHQSGDAVLRVEFLLCKAMLLDEVRQHLELLQVVQLLVL